MNQTLKEMLKPPFECNDEGIVMNKDGTIVIEIFGEKNIYTFITDALNEKAKKVFEYKKQNCANCVKFHSECFGHIPVEGEEYTCKERIEQC